MPRPEDKQIAKEIMIAYMSHADVGAMFSPVTVDEVHFESIWKRILDAVTGPEQPPMSA